MNAHHKLSFVLSITMLGAVLTPAAGYVIAACVSAVAAIASVFLNGWYQRRRAPVLESSVVAIMAKEAIARDAEIDRLHVDNQKLADTIDVLRLTQDA